MHSFTDPLSLAHTLSYINFLFDWLGSEMCSYEYYTPRFLALFASCKILILALLLDGDDADDGSNVDGCVTVPPLSLLFASTSVVGDDGGGAATAASHDTK